MTRRDYFPVIASDSEAIQSLRSKILDCFVATLLAMTVPGSTHRVGKAKRARHKTLHTPSLRATAKQSSHLAARFWIASAFALTRFGELAPGDAYVPEGFESTASSSSTS